MTAPKEAKGFIPVTLAMVDGDAAELQRLARLGAEQLGTVVGEVGLTWNENSGGFDLRAMVMPR